MNHSQQQKKIKSCACSVALGAHEQAFKAMKVTGTVLKKSQRYNAKGDADCLHRDIKAQNAWLLANIFYASDNYLYCAACIVSVLGVREKRLARLRKVKRSELPAEHKLSGKPSRQAIMMHSYRVLQGILCRFIPFLDGKGRVFKRKLNSDFWGGEHVVST